MKYWILLILITFTTLIVHTQVGGLPELQRLKAENHQLKLQVAQCQVGITKINLQNEEAQLIEEFRSIMKVEDKSKMFNWNTLTFEDSK